VFVGATRRRIDDMSKPITSVLADALRLDDEARAELLASLDGPADADAAEAWDVEIDRRIEAIEAGHLALEPWDDVRRRIERDILGR
jgi:broad specificity phosphatase PhoE